MKKLLVSACLLGDPVRYDGQSKTFHHSALDLLVKADRIIAFCPEVAGGLPIPRDAAEIQFGDGNAVINKAAKVSTRGGEDVTDYFIRGAQLALDLCLKNGIKVAVLTDLSPSCGSSHIYDGTFYRAKIRGTGVTTALLKQHGVRVFSQHRIDDAISQLTG